MAAPPRRARRGSSREWTPFEEQMGGEKKDNEGRSTEKRCARITECILRTHSTESILLVRAFQEPIPRLRSRSANAEGECKIGAYIIFIWVLF